MPKIYKKRGFFAVLICLLIVLNFFLFSAKASPSGKVQFSADTIIDLSGLDTTLYAISGSECDSLNVSGSILDVDIPDANIFTLGTIDHKVLRLAPSGGEVSLTFSSEYFSEGYVKQWTLESNISNTKIDILIGTSQPNRSYLVRVDGVDYGYFDTDSTGELTFTYTGGFSEKTFTIVQKNRPEKGARPSRTGNNLFHILLISLFISLLIFIRSKRLRHKKLTRK